MLVGAGSFGVHFQYPRLLFLIQAKRDGAGKGVAADLVQSLLGDAVQGILTLDRQPGLACQALFHQHVLS